MPAANPLLQPVIWPLLFVLLAVSPVIAKAPDLKDDQKLREELRRRGFLDMLDLLLEEHPPDDIADAKLLQRSIRMQKANRPNTPPDRKKSFIEEGIAILDDLIKARPDDPRCVQWKMDRAHDILYQLGEPYFNNILFKGGSDNDRSRLRDLTGKASSLFDELHKELDAEYKRFDALDPDAFEKEVKAGNVDRVETLRPLAAYHRQWARFYSALALPPGDQDAVAILQDLVTYMAKDSRLTSLDHAATGVQAQALWLTGTALRMLGQFKDALDHLSKAIEVIEKLPDQQRADLAWVAVLARLEQVKTLRDQGSFEQAVDLARRFHEWADRNLPHNYAALEAIALLEGTIYTAQADLLRKQGDLQGAKTLQIQSRKPLIQLARSHPRFQDRIYQTVYEMVGDVDDLDSLDSFEKNACLGGLLVDARDLAAKIEAARDESEKRELRSRRDAKLDRAIKVGDNLLNDESDLARQLRPDILFNVAVCRYQRGSSVQAVDTFLTLLETYPRFEHSRTAAETAVRLAHLRLQQPAGNPDRADQDRFIRAASIYLGLCQDDPQAADWKLLLAQTLSLVGRTEEAARAYDLVPQDHPRYLDARFLSLQLRIRNLDLAARNDRKARNAAESLASDALALADQTAALAEKTDDEGRRKTLNDLSAAAWLMAAELYASPALDQAEQALAVVSALEKRLRLDGEFVGRMLRIRIVALQALHRLDEASALVSDYLARESGNAGAVVQGLLGSIRREIEADRLTGRKEPARQRAREALRLADQLRDWASRNTDKLKPGDLDAFTLILAESSLDACEYDKALKWFTECREKFTSDDPTDRQRRGVVQHGLAEAHFQRKEYTQALPLFYELWTGAPENGRLWWQALLRNLQCHHALGKDPAVVRASIQQHRHRFPDMGGPALKAEFDRLEQQLH